MIIFLYENKNKKINYFNNLTISFALIKTIINKK